MKEILMIEDFPVLHKLYGDYLKDHGYKVATAVDPVEALEILQNREFDFILLDLLLPKMNGVEFLEKFNPIKPSKTKIIVLSDFNRPQTVRRAYELGIDGFWIKVENNPSELLKKLNELSRVVDSDTDLDKDLLQTDQQ